MKLNTTESVADALGITPQRVRQLVKELGISRVACPCCGAKDRGITDADVKKLEKRKTQPGPMKKGTAP